jgi:hypothetical protein
VDGLQLDHGRVLGEPVEHASGSDRGELLAIADGDQLRACALHQLRERVEAFVVGHARLVEDHGRVGTDVDAARVRSRDERVEREGLPLEHRAVGAQSLGGRPGHGDPDSCPSGRLLGACGRVDHDALPCAGGADERRGALRSCQDEQRSCLLVGERAADALRYLARGVRSRLVPGVASSGSGEAGSASFDRLLLGADRERRHPAAFEGEDSPIADHAVRDL